jgi:uncharacterized protein
MPLISRATAAELERVLRYPKFRLSSTERHELVGEYLPWCEVVEITNRYVSVCRDEKGQPFLDLAQSGKAEFLVSGDRDLLALAGKTDFLIENPGAYRRRVFGGWWFHLADSVWNLLTSIPSIHSEGGHSSRPQSADEPHLLSGDSLF